uniref:Putative major epididymal secretory protein he1 n=1 Tax=Lutzomyia longipalpis TaxID=7200 RepID=A0A1B0CC73_LUTLO
MLRYLILAAFIPAILATEGVTTCAAGHDSPIQVTVEGCPVAPCDITLGGEAIMRVVFQAYQDIPSFSPRTIAFLLGIPVPYTLPPEIVNHACDHLEDGECPIPYGTVVTYVFRLPVGPNYPPTNNLQIELSLMDPSNNVINCVRVPINAVP